MIRYLKKGKDAQLRADDAAEMRATVEGILKEVERRGDDAVREYSRKFNNWDPASFTLSLRGSMSAEHGIGASKLEDLRRYKSDVELTLMHAIKRALDPLGIMNPGKIIANPSITPPVDRRCLSNRVLT